MKARTAMGIAAVVVGVGSLGALGLCSLSCLGMLAGSSSQTAAVSPDLRPRPRPRPPKVDAEEQPPPNDAAPVTEHAELPAEESAESVDVAAAAPEEAEGLSLWSKLKNRFRRSPKDGVPESDRPAEPIPQLYFADVAEDVEEFELVVEASEPLRSLDEAFDRLPDFPTVADVNRELNSLPIVLDIDVERCGFDAGHKKYLDFALIVGKSRSDPDLTAFAVAGEEATPWLREHVQKGDRVRVFGYLHGAEDSLGKPRLYVTSCDVLVLERKGEGRGPQ